MIKFLEAMVPFIPVMLVIVGAGIPGIITLYQQKESKKEKIDLAKFMQRRSMIEELYYDLAEFNRKFTYYYVSSRELSTCRAGEYRDIVQRTETQKENARVMHEQLGEMYLLSTKLVLLNESSIATDLDLYISSSSKLYFQIQSDLNTNGTFDIQSANEVKTMSSAKLNVVLVELAAAFDKTML